MTTLLSTFKLLLMTTIIAIPTISQAENTTNSPNGIKYPTGLKNWRVISTSFRKDNNTQRVILGNTIAINAARSGHINPWPQGTILAKLVWKNTEHPQWDTAIVPGQFVHSEIMIKDAAKYNSTQGWGYARWQGTDQQPYGKDESFAKECSSCHANASTTDYVFTIPATIP